jgi:pimeloyl-ACP methyl ester carboxylesterase
MDGIENLKIKKIRRLNAGSRTRIQVIKGLRRLKCRMLNAGTKSPLISQLKIHYSLPLCSMFNFLMIFRQYIFFISIPYFASMNPIILLHGALGAKTQMHPMKIELENHGHRVFTMNFSGHNGNPYSTNGFGIETFAGDVRRFMEDNQLQRADIFGYSMGGYVALWLAHTDPERIGRITTLGTKFDWDPRSAKKEVAKMNPEKILLKVPGFARILESRHKPNDWKELLDRTASMMTSLGASPLLSEEILKNIQTPTVICLGDKDDMADRNYSERVASLLPNGKFILLENTTHPIEKVRYIPFV